MTKEKNIFVKYDTYEISFEMFHDTFSSVMGANRNFIHLYGFYEIIIFELQEKKNTRT